MTMPDREKGKLEKRTFPATTLSYGVRSEGEGERLVGHAAVFNVIGDGGWFREKIAPGAFARAIIEDDVRALFNHDKNYVLGRNKSGTLSMREDETGLWIENDPPITQLIRDLVLAPIGRGDITQMSFAFEILDEERVAGKDGAPDLFIVREVKLWDVSPVTYPFYEQTDISIHSREAWRREQHREQIKNPVGVKKKLFRLVIDETKTWLKGGKTK
jgi:uncharacterized protein